LGTRHPKYFASRVLGQTFQRARGAHKYRAGPNEDGQPENKTDFFWTSRSDGQKFNFTVSCALNV